MTKAVDLPSRRAARENAFRWMAGTVVALFVAFAALGGGFLWYQNASVWVDHTRQVRSEIDLLMLSLTQAESAQRGLLLADDPRFRRELALAKARTEASLARLQTMTADNPSQQRRIAELGALQMQRMRAIDDTVAGAASGGRQTVGGLQQGDGLRAMAEVRVLVAELKREETTLERRREGRAHTVRLALFAALAAFAVLLSLLFLRALRDIALDREVEAETSDRLRALVAERTLLLDEVNHRVKNSLQQVASVIRLQSRTVAHEGARAALEQALGRIMAVGRVHEQLYRTGGEVGVFDAGEYTRDLATELVDSMGRDDVELKLDVSSAQLDLGRAVPMALILNELVTNALKYGCPPGARCCLHVGFGAVEGGYRLSVADDGPGLPADFRARTANSLGMRVIEALAKQLNGRFVVESPSAGAELAVVFSKGPR